MRSILFALLLLPALAAPAAAPSPTQYALDYVCSVTNTDCSDLTAPKLTYSHLSRTQGAWGIYWPIDGADDFVELDYSLASAIEQGDMSQKLAWDVLVHETTHYVDYKLHVTNWADGGTVCDSEELAWSVGNLWLLEHDGYELIDWNWRELYQNC